jgi:hypothetical protein
MARSKACVCWRPVSFHGGEGFVVSIQKDVAVPPGTIEPFSRDIQCEPGTSSDRSSLIGSPKLFINLGPKPNMKLWSVSDPEIVNNFGLPIRDGPLFKRLTEHFVLGYSHSVPDGTNASFLC